MAFGVPEPTGFPYGKVWPGYGGGAAGEFQRTAPGATGGMGTAGPGSEADVTVQPEPGTPSGFGGGPALSSMGALPGSVQPSLPTMGGAGGPGLGAYPAGTPDIYSRLRGMWSFGGPAGGMPGYIQGLNPRSPTNPYLAMMPRGFGGRFGGQDFYSWLSQMFNPMRTIAR